MPNLKFFILKMKCSFLLEYVKIAKIVKFQQLFRNRILRNKQNNKHLKLMNTDLCLKSVISRMRIICSVSTNDVTDYMYVHLRSCMS